MNRTDAAAILNVDPSASPEEARRAYQELFTEHQVRLTNAPTPALRSLYQARLLELDEARDAFLTQSLADADSDLPTDQPTIPYEHGGKSPPPPPQFPPQQPPPTPGPRPGQTGTRQSRAYGPPPPPPMPTPAPSTTSTKPAGGAKWIGIVVVAAVVAFAIAKYAGVFSGGDHSTSADTAVVAPAPSSVRAADSLPKLRENITVARVEFGRGDYDAANGALKAADSTYFHFGPATATSDTAVIKLKTEMDSMRTKVARACEALKKVAARHPGEPTCKSL